MARLLTLLMMLLTACSGCGGGSSAESTFTEAPPETEDVVEEDVAEEPMPPPDPTGPPAETTLKAIKYVLAPCASPLVFTLPARMKVGADLLQVKAEGTQKTLTLNGVDLWQTSADDRSTFAFDLNVKALGAEAPYPSYLCNSIVTSFPDDANPDNQKGSVEIDAAGATATVIWHTRREADKDLAYRIEVALPGATESIVFEGE